MKDNKMDDGNYISTAKITIFIVIDITDKHEYQELSFKGTNIVVLN